MADVIVRDTRSGIYAIRNKKNGKMYVGSAVNFGKRWRVHLHHLRAGTHHSKKLQSAWIKHGDDVFEFSVLELVADLPKLIEVEQAWIDKCVPHKNGYNMSPTAGSSLGLYHSEESKQKMSEIHTGSVPSEDARKKMSLARIGRKDSEETRRKKSEVARNRTFSEETLRRMSEGQKRRFQSEDERQKISDKIKVINATEEYKQKQRVAKLGKKASDETRKKMSDSHRRRLAERQVQQAA